MCMYISYFHKQNEFGMLLLDQGPSGFSPAMESNYGILTMTDC